MDRVEAALARVRGETTVSGKHVYMDVEIQHGIGASAQGLAIGSEPIAGRLVFEVFTDLMPETV